MGVPQEPAPSPTVFVVEDDPNISELLRLSFPEDRYQVVASDDCRRVLEMIEGGSRPAAILLDLMMPHMSGLDLLEVIHARFPGLKVIVISGITDVRTVVRAMQLGALDYITKPFDREKVRSCVERAIGGHYPAPPAPPARNAPAPPPGAVFLPPSAAMAPLLDTARKVASTNIPVLITGESGVGKEVIAREIHRLSPFAQGPFVKVNCAALPAAMLESELFGHERGAFTGAHRARPSRFEAAEGGTLVLDEIGELELSLQAKLLHVLQDGNYNRLGSNRLLRSRARIVVLTNRELEAEVQRGAFRADLFYRLNVVRLHIPPLRERREDILPLARHFLAQFNRQHDGTLTLDPEASEVLQCYFWPGNVRELANVIHRSVVLDRFEREQLGRKGQGAPRSGPDPLPEPAPVEAPPPPTLPSRPAPLPLKEVGRQAAAQAETEAIRAQLLLHRGNKTRTAKALGISYKALLYKIRDYRIEGDD